MGVPPVILDASPTAAFIPDAGDLEMFVVAVLDSLIHALELSLQLIGVLILTLILNLIFR
jgi:hypothetical protein